MLAELKTAKTSECVVQMCICLRRIAGGLNKGQQMQLASEWIGPILDKKTGKIEIKRKGDLYLYSEKMRALAALERLELPFKMRVGEALVDRILYHTPSQVDYWALGRIGARHLFYGSAGQVVPKESVARWVGRLLSHQPTAENQEAMLFALRQMARKTNQRELNLPEEITQKVLHAYPQTDLKEWLVEIKEVTESEQEQFFGDQLPAGLLLDIS